MKKAIKTGIFQTLGLLFLAITLILSRLSRYYEIPVLEVLRIIFLAAAAICLVINLLKNSRRI